MAMAAPHGPSPSEDTLPSSENKMETDIAGSASASGLEKSSSLSKPTCVIVLGMAGSGKTSFVQKNNRAKKFMAAWDAVKAGMSVRRACREFDVPRSTLRDKINMKTPITIIPKTALTVDEETKFSQWIVNMVRSGFEITTKDFLQNIQTYLNQRNEPNKRFKGNNLPQRSWYYDFLKRHPELTERTTREQGSVKALVAPSKMEDWFDGLSSFVQETDPSLLHEPDRWYNCGEFGFAMCHQSKTVLAPREDHHPYLNTSRSRYQITTLCCMSAAGHFNRPLIVIPGKTLVLNPFDHFKECSVGLSENGLVTEELFSNWLKKVFVPGLNEKRVKRPVLLFLDGLRSHKSKLASDICLENGVILYCLQANTSLLQPLGLSFFESLKQHWGDAVADFQTQNPGMAVTKASFPLVFKTAYEKSCSCSAELARVGFEKAGLFPLCKDVVLDTKEMLTCNMLHAPLPSFSVPSSTPSLSGPPSLVEKFQLLESIMTEEIREEFERRMEVGYDLTDDCFYNTWKEGKILIWNSLCPSSSSSSLRPTSAGHSSASCLNLPSASTSSPSSSSVQIFPHSTDSVSSSSVSPLSLDDFLRSQTIQVQGAKRRKVEVLHNMVLTSEECVRYFVQDEEAKKEEEKTKEQAKKEDLNKKLQESIQQKKIRREEKLKEQKKIEQEKIEEQKKMEQEKIEEQKKMEQENKKEQKKNEQEKKKEQRGKNKKEKGEMKKEKRKVSKRGKRKRKTVSSSEDEDM